MNYVVGRAKSNGEFNHILEVVQVNRDDITFEL
jgi:hypothetical protein